MKYYDKCEDGFCGECGQLWGTCVHTKNKQNPWEKEIKFINGSVIKVINSSNVVRGSQSKQTKRTEEEE